MDFQNSRRPPIIKTGLVAIYAGLFLGIFYIWYEWNWNNFLSGVSAGIGFSLTFYLTAGVLRLSMEKWRLYFHISIAGLIGGLIWWAVAKTQINFLIPTVIGAVVAPVAMWLETGRSNKKTT